MASSTSCRLCRVSAMAMLLLLATLCSNARACAEGDMMLLQRQQHSTSPVRAIPSRLKVRSPQATDLTVAGALPSSEDSSAAATQDTSSGLPVGNPTPLPEGYTMPEPFECVYLHWPPRNIRGVPASDSSSIVTCCLNPQCNPRSQLHIKLLSPVLQHLSRRSRFQGLSPSILIGECHLHLYRQAEDPSNYLTYSLKHPAPSSKQCRILKPSLQ